MKLMFGPVAAQNALTVGVAPVAPSNVFSN